MSTTPYIRYRKRRAWNYSLAETLYVQTALRPVYIIHCGPHLTVHIDGMMVISAGYCWDGATWFPDFDSIKRASVIHDALYQLMREGYLEADRWREYADSVLHDCCIEDGMLPFLAKAVYRGVRLGAASAARSDVLTAP
uniref:DUF1353 domain-containing protein n=1 Tax=viral metagenome TaxID=1070528 RepID=A0A6M3JE99_9ZZZZ